MKKEAYFKLMGLNKRATTPTEEILASHITGAIPYVGYINAPADIVGRVIGDNSETESYDKDSLGYLPGVSNYRVQRRRAEAAKLLGAKKTQAINEMLGGVTGSLVGAGVGAIPGALIGNAIGSRTGDAEGGMVGTLMGGAIGAGAGAITPHIIATLAALIKKRRTGAEQKEYEENGGTGNYLIPGMATYNDFKTKGFLMGDQYKKLREASYKKNKKSKKKQEQPDLSLARKAKKEADKDPFGGIKIIRKS